ncbi:hypothetical protein [Sphingobium sp. B11D3D]|uniref:hypothetical protein n=1 Tax=Sphingobium sp. B11D3D TaxID=2940576 RepID=UPI0022243F39|nr:hypothetical protein [Sphingobium sp. B11D3D]
MRHLALSAIVAVLASCSGASGPSSDVARNGCGDLTAGFHHANDEAFWSERPTGIEPPYVNALRIDGSGRFLWGDNAAAISEAKLDEYLGQTASFPIAVYVALDFHPDTPCTAINKARTLMNRHLSCAESGLCLQGDYRAWIESNNR